MEIGWIYWKSAEYKHGPFWFGQINSSLRLTDWVTYFEQFPVTHQNSFKGQNLISDYQANCGI